MIEYLDVIILGVIGWVLATQYKQHGCLKRIEGFLGSKFKK